MQTSPERADVQVSITVIHYLDESKTDSEDIEATGYYEYGYVTTETQVMTTLSSLGDSWVLASYSATDLHVMREYTGS
jgi:hypothetical protein